MLHFFISRGRTILGKKTREKEMEKRSAVSGRLGRGIAQARSVYLNLYVPCVIRKTRRSIRVPSAFAIERAARPFLAASLYCVCSFSLRLLLERKKGIKGRLRARSRTREGKKKFIGDEPCTPGWTLKMARSMIRSREHRDTRVRRFLDRWRGWPVVRVAVRFENWSAVNCFVGDSCQHAVHRSVSRWRASTELSRRVYGESFSLFLFFLHISLWKFRAGSRSWSKPMMTGER